MKIFSTLFFKIFILDIPVRYTKVSGIRATTTHFLHIEFTFLSLIDLGIWF